MKADVTNNQLREKKLIFHITFHWQIDQLKFHLENLFSWSISKNAEFIITAAHKQNLQEIEKFCQDNYRDQKVEYVFIPIDHGYHMGTIHNVIDGINYIDDNKSYDYIVNIEADNMFYDEKKFLKILNMMIDQNKDLLLIEEGKGKGLHTSFPGKSLPRYLHITTINIYSKNYIKNYFPKEYVDEYMNFGFGGRPGTPFEDYLSLSTIKKNNLTEENQMDFWNKHGLRLDYDRNRIIFEGWYYPDNLTPDKFVKWGILNCFATCGEDNLIQERMGPHGWNMVKTFINIHKPLLHESE